MGRLLQSSPARARRALEGDGPPSPRPPSPQPQALLGPPAPERPNSSSGDSVSGGISPEECAKRKAWQAARMAAKAAAVQAKAAAVPAAAAAKAQAKEVAQEGFASIASIVAKPN